MTNINTTEHVNVKLQEINENHATIEIEGKSIQLKIGEEKKVDIDVEIIDYVPHFKV